MLNSIRVRTSQGTQYIPNPRQANPLGLRGRPLIGQDACAPGCQACVSVCPTQAITLGSLTGGQGNAEPVAIDLGRCVLCGDCEPVCPSRKLSFDNHFKLAATERAGLMLSATRPAPDPVKVSAALHARFGRSLKLRSVSAGGCNGCELEVNALSNVNFDIGRYGIDIVASPRHADGLVLTGPITRNMAEALQTCWDAMPAPKLVIAVGACAISGSPFEGSSAIDRSFLERFKPALFVPGCPPHPLTFLCGILDLLGMPSWRQIVIPARRVGCQHDCPREPRLRAIRAGCRSAVRVELLPHPWYFLWQGVAYLSAITASELLVGVLRAQDSAVRAWRTAFVENLLAALPTLPVDLETARVHALLLVHLPGHETIGAHDALIGATALRHGYAVLTRNVKDFRKLAGVRVLEYTVAL